MYEHYLKNLEDAYFHKLDQQNIEKLREQVHHDHDLRDLSKQTGIANHDLLEKLFKVGLRQHTLLALKLIPLVHVALADGVIDEAEKQEILRYVREKKLVSNDQALDTLKSWLEGQFDSDIFNTWKAFLADFSKELSSAAKQSLKDEVLKEARLVAEAYNSLWGAGTRVSKQEKLTLEEIENTFDF